VAWAKTGMPRKPRDERAAGIYHVFARGNDRRRIFLDDDDRTQYLGLLGRVTVHRRWRTLAYCLMENHMHLLIETTAPNLGAGMHRLQGGYAQRFNHRHERTGHVFERRYGAKPIAGDAQLQVTSAYIALNPLRAGLCGRPEEWRWGSHATIRGAGAPRPYWLDVARLLEFFGAVGGDPLDRYERLVAERGEGQGGPGPLDAENLVV
jgi:putative transposase